MAGGIQVGTTASSPESIKLDEQVKEIAKSLIKKKSNKYTFSTGHEQRKPIWPSVLTGCKPDGGLWFNENMEIYAAFEAKHQNIKGNAIERHAKNLAVCIKHKAEDFKYVTFMTGAGSRPDGVLDRYARTMLYCHNAEDHQEINVLHPRGLSFFLSEEGFTDEFIRSIMDQAL